MSSSGQNKSEAIEREERMKVFFFFSGAPDHGPSSAMVSAMAERHRYLTKPECNGSAEQRLKEGTPVRQNRPGIEPGPPETPPPNGAPDQVVVQGLL